MWIGGCRRKKNGYERGKIMGKELKGLGMNSKLSAVVDVNNKGKNRVIGVGSFRCDAGVVRRVGVESMKGVEKEKRIWRLKDLGGDGDRGVDSE